MAPGDKQRSLTLLAKVDEQTINRSIQRFRELRAAEQAVVSGQEDLDQSSDQVESSLGAVSNATARNIAELQRRAAAARLETEASLRQVEALRDEAKARDEVTEAAREQATAEQQADSAAPTGGGKHLGRLSSGAAALGGLESLVGAGPAGGALRGVSSLARLSQSIQQLSAESDVAISSIGQGVPALAGLNTAIGGLAAAGAAGIALAALSLAIQKFTKDLEAAQARFDDAFSAQEEYYRLVKTGTTESISAQLENLKVEKFVREQTIRDTQRATEGLTGFQKVLYDIGNFLGMGPAKDIKQASEEINKLDAQINAYQSALKSQEVQQRGAAEAAKQQAQDQQKAANEVRQSTQATQAATVAERARTQAIQQTTQAMQASEMQQRRDVQIKYFDDKKKLEADYNKQLLANTQQRNKILQAFDDDRLRDQTLAARESASMERREVFDKRTQQLRESMAEFDALLNLDFAAVSRMRREQKTQSVIDQAQKQFDANERRIGEIYRIEDARVALAKQIFEIDQQRREIMAQERAALADLVKQLYAGTRDIIMSRPTRRAEGGWLNAGQRSTVNELPGQRESFNGVALPGGKGLFFPLEGGMVNSGNRSVTVLPGAIQVSGAGDPHTVAREVERQLEKIIR